MSLEILCAVLALPTGLAVLAAGKLWDREHPTTDREAHR